MDDTPPFWSNFFFRSLTLGLPFGVAQAPEPGCRESTGLETDRTLFDRGSVRFAAMGGWRGVVPSPLERRDGRTTVDEAMGMASGSLSGE